MSYRPLPDSLTIKSSNIEGLGLFCVKVIEAGTVLGICHVSDGEFVNGYIRTPLGGFFNHSDDPNCETFTEGRYIYLKAIHTILPGQELTVKYWMYNAESFK